MEQASKQPRKAIKKAIKVVVILLCVFVSLPFVLAALLLINPVQNKVVDWTASYISEEIGHEIEIGSIYIKSFSGLIVNQALLRDYKQDTLIYAGRVELGLSAFNLSASAFMLEGVQLDSGFFNLRVYEGDSVSNLTHFIEKIPKSTDTISTPFLRIASDKVKVRSSRFAYNNDNIDPITVEKIDFAHLLIRGLNAEFTNINIIGDSVAACIDELTLQEKSGFIIRHLGAEATVVNGNVRCKNLTLRTNEGVVRGNYEMLSDGWANYTAFIQEVRLRADLYESEIQFDDIAYFTPNLRGFLTPLRFTGRVSGTIDDLRANVDELRFVNQGYLRGKLKIKGLPDIEGTFIDADLDQLYSTFEDATKINLPKDGGFVQLSFPENVMRMKYVDFVGSFTGFVNDFVTSGNIETALGTLEADVNVKIDDQFRYSGELFTNNFQLGRLIDAKPQVNSIAVDLRIRGVGLDIKTMDVFAVGKVQHVDVFGYDYRDIIVDGQFTNLVFNGDISIADTNINLDFAGMMDFREEIPKLIAHSEIRHLNLAELNILPQDTFGVYKGTVDINLNGGNRRELNGRLVLKDASYESNTDKIELKEFVINDRIIKAGHDIEIESDYFTAKVIGRTSLLEAPYAFLQVGNKYLPAFIPKITNNEIDTLQDFMFEFVVANDKDLTRFISKDLVLKDPIHINGSLDMKGNLFTLKSDSMSWGYADFKFDKNMIEVYPLNQDLVVKTFVGKTELISNYSLAALQATAKVRHDSVLLKTDWVGASELSDKGSFGVVLYRTDLMPWNMLIKEMNVNVSGSEWRAPKKALISADTNQVIVHDLQLVSQNGLIKADGVLSKIKPSELDLRLENFDLSYLSGFSLVEQEILGILDGSIDVGYENDSLVLDGDIDIDTLLIDGVEVGHMAGEANYNSIQKKVDVNMNIAYQGNETVKLIGDYYPERDKEQLDLEASFTGFSVVTFEPFLKNVMNEMKGTIDGSLSILGTLKKPDISGGLKINQFGGKVPYLNTYYKLEEGNVLVYPGLIAMDRAEVIDQNGSRAYTNVQIFHDYFQNLSYDVFLEAEEFLCLNTTVAENESYYGQAILTGDINVGGYASHTYIEVIAGTDKGTKLSIPLDGGGDVSEFDYINFVDTTRFSHEYKSQALKQEVSGLELDFKLAVDKDAQVQIIFDEKVGDIIKVRGDGDMLMLIDNKGKFNMYGDYVISNGEYLFTLQNVINKRFEVEPGSKLTWNGEVDEARLDLTAIYKLKASPAAMVEAMTSAPGGIDDVYRQRLPTNVNLLMVGPISSPDISFDVDLPSLPESDVANQLLAPGLASKEQITSQAFSLLLAQQFSSGNGNVALGGAGQSSGFEVLSNQLSNWASQYSEKFDVGISYDSYTDQNGQEASETELSFSKNFFNDRVEVEVNGSVQNNSSSDEEEQTSNLAGEFNVDYKVNKDGSLVARVYNESNTQSAANLNNSPYTQGVGLQYRKEFDTWGQFFKQLFSSGNKENKE